MCTVSKVSSPDKVRRWAFFLLASQVLWALKKYSNLPNLDKQEHFALSDSDSSSNECMGCMCARSVSAARVNLIHGGRSQRQDKLDRAGGLWPPTPALLHFRDTNIAQKPAMWLHGNFRRQFPKASGLRYPTIADHTMVFYP